MGNYLLRAMPASGFAALQPHLVHVELPVDTILAEVGERIEQHFFLDRGLASALAHSGDDQIIEAGLLGREAMTGLQVLLKVDTFPYQLLMQISGSGWQISSQKLREVITQDAGTEELLLHFVHSLELQVIHSMLAHARFNVHQRLARWLIMTHDRMDGDDLPLTHEFLAMMLGVRRAGVTDALHVIEGLGAIKATRGNVHVLSRSGLEQIADGSYGSPEAEYQRLTGVQLRRQHLAG